MPAKSKQRRDAPLLFERDVNKSSLHTSQESSPFDLNKATRSLAQICLCSQMHAQLVAWSDCKGKRTQRAICQRDSVPAPSALSPHTPLRFQLSHQLHLAHQIKLVLCPDANVRKGESTRRPKLIYWKCGVVGGTCRCRKTQALKIPRGRKGMA